MRVATALFVRLSTSGRGTLPRNPRNARNPRSPRNLGTQRTSRRNLGSRRNHPNLRSRHVGLIDTETANFVDMTEHSRRKSDRFNRKTTSRLTGIPFSESNARSRSPTSQRSMNEQAQQHFLAYHQRAKMGAAWICALSQLISSRSRRRAGAPSSPNPVSAVRGNTALGRRREGQSIEWLHMPVLDKLMTFLQLYSEL
jgi:hypothetical protein